MGRRRMDLEYLGSQLVGRHRMDVECRDSTGNLLSDAGGARFTEEDGPTHERARIKSPWLAPKQLHVLFCYKYHRAPHFGRVHRELFDVEKGCSLMEEDHGPQWRNWVTRS